VDADIAHPLTQHVLRQLQIQDDDGAFWAGDLELVEEVVAVG
jgi:hypothetical protein